MKKIIKKLFGIDQIEKQLEEAQQSLESTKEKLDEYENADSDPKATATENKEPYIAVLDLDLDQENPTYGSVELDWNEYFIKQLREQGYPGKTDEDVVDLWFQNVCRNIVLETLEQEESAIDSGNIRYINRRRLADGKTEVS